MENAFPRQPGTGNVITMAHRSALPPTMTRLSGTLLALAAIWPAVATSPADASSRPAPPQRFAPAALGQDGRITLTPAFSPDGTTIYFAQSECTPIWECPQRLKRSRRTPSGWSTPELVPLPGEGRVDWPSVTPDGRRLLFSWATRRDRHAGRDVLDDFDLYALDLEDPAAIPQPLDMADINRVRGGAIRTTRYVHNETAPSLTTDGDLYFWTERLDGIGERDVYVAPSDGRGGFQTARPLPAPINSRRRDDGAWVSADGNTMIVNYGDRGGSGGADLFVAHRAGAVWSTPVNLGPLVNSSHNDFAGRLTPDGRTLVFTSDRPVGDGEPGLLQVWHIATDALPHLFR